jgi:signal transduction histidine kinase
MADSPRLSSRFRGLSGKVLALTIIFVMLGEVMIFLPSIANFRIQWMKTRISMAEIAALAAEATPGRELDERLRKEILMGAGVVAVSLKRGDTRQLMLSSNEAVTVEEAFDLRPGRPYMTLLEALKTLVRSTDRVIKVTDFPPNMSGDVIDVALHEAPLTKAMQSYALNILLLSVVLSLVVAAMIFAALNRVLVRPMQHLSRNMTLFGDKPEDQGRIIKPSNRRDEIGIAEHELHDMQGQLQSLLQQKSRLAALGLAVAKVSHDLRNMLTSAQLISDRLGDVRDPNVQRFAPKLITSLDRAINFLNQTLTYGQAKERAPQRSSLLVHDVAQDVIDSHQLAAPDLQLDNEVPRHLVVDADREHLTRILTNLVRNAIQAFDAAGDKHASPRVCLRGARQGSVTTIEVADNGPGIPPAVRDKLFEAFQTAAKPGGTGLGLAISAELAHAHGGDISVGVSTADGSVFIVSIPDAPLAMTKIAPRQRAVRS